MGNNSNIIINYFMHYVYWYNINNLKLLWVDIMDKDIAIQSAFFLFVFGIFYIHLQYTINDLDLNYTQIIYNDLNKTINNITYLEQKFNNITEVTRISNNTHYVKDKINYQIREINWCSKKAELVKSKGQSMFPYSWSNGWHWREPVKFNNIEIGDIITYKTDKEDIHHAVCNIYNDYLIACGYNNLNYDKKVYPEQVLYKDCLPKANS